MKYLRTIIVSGALALLAAAAPSLLNVHTNVAYAATDNCTITTADIAQISAIQNDPTLSYSDEIKQELALRQQLVGETIACAEQDVQTLQATLQATPVDDESQALQSQFLGQLTDATTFYNIELAKLDGSVISGTETVAKEVLQWRESNFLPLTEQINNFILWSQNQPLFDTAQIRMDQTSRAVTFLESAAPNPALQTAFDSALASFNTAQSQNAAAKASLPQLSSANQSLTLIKESLDSLSATYQDFSTVSGLIKGILPQ
jgi:hypothetical protein